MQSQLWIDDLWVFCGRCAVKTSANILSSKRNDKRKQQLSNDCCIPTNLMFYVWCIHLMNMKIPETKNSNLDLFQSKFLHSASVLRKKFNKSIWKFRILNIWSNVVRTKDFKQIFETHFRNDQQDKNELQSNKVPRSIISKISNQSLSIVFLLLECFKMFLNILNIFY